MDNGGKWLPRKLYWLSPTTNQKSGAITNKCIVKKDTTGNFKWALKHKRSGEASRECKQQKTYIKIEMQQPITKQNDRSNMSLKQQNASRRSFLIHIRYLSASLFSWMCFVFAERRTYQHLRGLVSRENSHRHRTHRGHFQSFLHDRAEVWGGTDNTNKPLYALTPNTPWHQI